MSQDSLKNKTIKGVGWSFGGSAASYGIQFIVGIVLARLLSPEEYGLIGIITIFITIFNGIVDSGFSSALIRKSDATEKDYNTAFITNLLFSITLFVFLYFGAPFIANFFKNQQLVALTRVMGFSLILNALSMIQVTLLTKEIDFKTQTKSSIYSSLLSGIVGIAMAFGGLGVWSLVGQQLSRLTFNTIFLWIFRKWRPSFTFSVQSFKELWGYGWKLLVSGILNNLWNQLYQVVVGKVYTPVTLGFYTKAHEYVNLVSQNLNSVVQKVSFPALSKLQEDNAVLKQGYRRVIRVTMFVTFVLVLGLAACGKQFILVLIGEKWLPCVPFLQIICFQMVLYPLHSLNLNALQVKGRSDLFLKLEIIKKIIGVVPILLGIFVGIYSMLIASVFTGIISYYLNAYYTAPLLDYGIKEQVKDILPSLKVAVAMALPVYAMSFISINPFILLPLQIVVGAAITISICELTKLSEYLEIKSIARPIINKVIKCK